MCPSPEPDQKTASSAPFTATLFWFAGWDPILCPGWWAKHSIQPFRESRIAGRNDGELTLLLYSVVPPDCM